MTVRRSDYWSDACLDCQSVAVTWQWLARGLGKIRMPWGRTLHLLPSGKYQRTEGTHSSRRYLRRHTGSGSQKESDSLLESAWMATMLEGQRMATMSEGQWMATLLGQWWEPTSGRPCRPLTRRFGSSSLGLNRWSHSGKRRGPRKLRVDACDLRAQGRSGAPVHQQGQHQPHGSHHCCAQLRFG